MYVLTHPKKVAARTWSVECLSVECGKPASKRPCNIRLLLFNYQVRVERGGMHLHSHHSGELSQEG